MYRTFASLLIALMVALCLAAPAFAQASRTWISGVGDDVNPCSRTAPCKTFAGAISKTAAGGEVSVLDPGGFGAVTITKAITFDGQGELASITNPGTNAIVVAAGATDTVILRNLALNGVNSNISGGVNGIRFVSGRMLVVENVDISGNRQNNIEVALTPGATGSLLVRNSVLTSGATGVKLTSGTVSAVLDRVSINNAATGVDAVVGTVEVRDSVIIQSTAYGVLAEGGTIDIEATLLSGNAVAVQAQAASTVRISNSQLYNNLAGFGCGGGTLASDQTNRKGGNIGGTGPVCTPNATITLQ